MLIATDLPSLSPPRPHRGVGPRSYRCLTQGACAHMTAGSHQLRLPICSLGGRQQVTLPIRRIVVNMGYSLETDPEVSQLLYIRSLARQRKSQESNDEPLTEVESGMLTT